MLTRTGQAGFIPCCVGRWEFPANDPAIETRQEIYPPHQRNSTTATWAPCHRRAVFRFNPTMKRRIFRHWFATAWIFLPPPTSLGLCWH